MKKYYTYTHITLDSNTIFYVGLGTKQFGDCTSLKNRYARAHSKYGKTKFWYKIVEKHGYRVGIIQEYESYEEAKNCEISNIALYGRRDLGKGTLCNLTDGGDGIFNHNFSKETKAKMSKSALIKIKEGRGLSKKQYREIGIKIGNSIRGRKTGRKLSQEAKENLKKAWVEKLGKRIIQEDLEGNFVKEWYIAKEAGEFYGVTYKAIWKAAKNYNEGATSVGYKWKFKN